MNSSEIFETQLNLISEGSEIRGKMTFDNITRVHGKLIGDIASKPGSTLIIGETGVIEGNITADQMVIDGFVKGDILASTRIVISGTGRVLGNIKAPNLLIEFGAYFEGKCSMEEQTTSRANLSLSPLASHV